MTKRIRLIRHELVPREGYFEVKFPDGRESVHFSWDDDLSRHIRHGMRTQAEALELAKALARAEQDKLDQKNDSDG